MVPQNALIKPATQQTQKLLADTVGSLLEVDFELRTYVKRTKPAPRPAATGGTPNAR